MTQAMVESLFDELLHSSKEEWIEKMEAVQFAVEPTKGFLSIAASINRALRKAEGEQAYIKILLASLIYNISVGYELGKKEFEGADLEKMLGV